MKAEKAAAVAVTGGGADEWRCRKHPAARSGGGVCPHCLRDRLLRLCPNCAHVRPCPCTSCASPSSSSSASGEAAVGRVHTLIEREHRIARSRSVAASSSLAGAASSAASAAAAGAVGGRRKARVWGWPPFWKPAARDGVAAAAEEDEEEGMGLARSSSVSATAVEAKAAAAAAKARWGWHFPSPLKAFRHRRSSASIPERG
uniref:Uncharacterized protein n=1 Tax=Leersia perrieri TaxID=77586 RepID=A0A0D9VJQ9_9ORYZ